MERLDIYLDMLHDYMFTRDHYSIDTMCERDTGIGFCWYIHLNVDEFKDLIYKDFAACLPELHEMIQAYYRKFNVNELPNGSKGLKVIKMRIILIKGAIHLMHLEKEP
ncbi:MAG: hypothetical protein KJS92_06090 [Bacteroidetes bacterium]|nr:hypothetical protein [Bacteroidota bacterium]